MGMIRGEKRGADGSRVSKQIHRENLFFAFTSRRNGRREVVCGWSSGPSKSDANNVVELYKHHILFGACVGSADTMAW